MQDPRKNIPDVIHTTADGEQYLLRAPSLVFRSDCMTQAERELPPRGIAALSAHSIMSIEEDGKTIIRPGAPITIDFPVSVSDMPPELAAQIAAWMGTLPTVERFVKPLIDRIEPIPEPAEDVQNVETEPLP